MDKGLDKAAPSDPNVLLFSELRYRHGRSEAPMCVPLSHRHELTELMFYWTRRILSTRVRETESHRIHIIFPREPSWLQSSHYISHPSVPQHRGLTYEMGVGVELNGSDQN